MPARLPCAVAALLLIVTIPRAEADEPRAWFSVEINRPARLLEHPLVTGTWRALAESPDFADRQRTPEFERLREATTLLENALGEDWRAAAARLVQRVSLKSFDPSRPNRGLVQLEADSGKTLAAMLTKMTERIPALQPLADAAAEPGESNVVKIGPVHAVVSGARLIVSAERDLVVAALKSPTADIPATAPLLAGRVELAALAKLPNYDADGLQIPAREAGAIAFVGGWIDRLRIGRELKFAVEHDESTLTLRGELVTAEGKKPVVPGFFPTAAEAPALRPEGTIFSTRWYRDYAAMWEARRDLVKADSLAVMERRDGEVRDQLRVLGMSRRPSEIVGMLGTDYHIVVTRGQRPDYDVDRRERLPQGAFAVSLRDANGFRETFQPIFRTVGLILAGQQKMLVKDVEHDDATITVARFRDDRTTRETGNAMRYHFSPSWTVTRDHFVIGSTTSVVRTMLDGLAADARASRTSEEASVPGTVLSLEAAAGALDDARPLLVGQTQLEQGVSSRRAESELAAAAAVLRGLGRATLRTEVDDSILRLTFVIGDE